MSGPISHPCHNALSLGSRDWNLTAWTKLLLVLWDGPWYRRRRLISWLPGRQVAQAFAALEKSQAASSSFVSFSFDNHSHVSQIPILEMRSRIIVSLVYLYIYILSLHTALLATVKKMHITQGWLHFLFRIALPLFYPYSSRIKQKGWIV